MLLGMYMAVCYLLVTIDRDLGVVACVKVSLIKLLLYVPGTVFCRV